MQLADFQHSSHRIICNFMFDISNERVCQKSERAGEWWWHGKWMNERVNRIVPGCRCCSSNFNLLKIIIAISLASTFQKLHSQQTRLQNNDNKRYENELQPFDLRLHLEIYLIFAMPFSHSMSLVWPINRQSGYPSWVASWFAVILTLLPTDANKIAVANRKTNGVKWYQSSAGQSRFNRLHEVILWKICDTKLIKQLG